MKDKLNKILEQVQTVKTSGTDTIVLAQVMMSLVQLIQEIDAENKKK